MEEETTDVATDTNVEVEEDTNISEEEETTSTDNAEDVEALKKQRDDALRAKAELTARAKKAEEELKALKAKSQEDNKPNDQHLSEELRLIARGLTDEAIDQAKIIAKGKEIPLTEAIKDPLFAIYQKDAEEKAKKEKAKLGASKGSGATGDKATFKSGMTKEEHQKAFQEALSK